MMQYSMFYDSIKCMSISVLFGMTLFLSACSDDEDPTITNPPKVDQVLVLNEGSFGTPTGEISTYSPSDQTIINDVFRNANGRGLGDTFQSMSLIGNKYYAVLQTSGFIEILDTSDFTSLGRITGMQVPRYLAHIDGDIGYVTSGFGNDKIYKISLSTSTVLAELDLPGVSNQMLVVDGIVAIAAETGIYLLDSATDTFVDTLSVGLNATDMMMDRNGDVWVSCAGQSWPPVVPASLHKINIADRTTQEIYSFSGFGSSSHLDMNGSLDSIFIVNDHVYKMSINNPSDLINVYNKPDGSNLYGLGVDPINSNVYIADAVDFVQSGVVTRVTSDGQILDVLNAGLIPNGFIFSK